MTPERLAFINKRLFRLNAKLARLAEWDVDPALKRKAVRSTKTALKRWEDILAGRRKDYS